MCTVAILLLLRMVAAGREVATVKSCVQSTGDFKQEGYTELAERWNWERMWKLQREKEFWVSLFWEVTDVEDAEMPDTCCHPLICLPSSEKQRTPLSLTFSPFPGCLNCPPFPCHEGEVPRKI